MSFSFPLKIKSSDFWLLIAESLALLGYWLPWLAQPAAALNLNGFELSEWVTFLPGVCDPTICDGSLPFAYIVLFPQTDFQYALLHARLAFLMPLGCLALLLGIVAARTRSRALLPGSWLGWGALALALVCAAVMFPAYPYILTAYADPEFQLHFAVAILVLLGLGGVWLLPNRINDWLQIVLVGIGLGYGLWTMLTLLPTVNDLLGAPWSIGPGWPVMLLGFAGLVVLGAGRVWKK